MEESGFGFDDFSVEMQDFEVRHTKKFDRMWRVEPGGSILQIPLIVDDIIYFGSLNYNVYAVNVNNGELVWKFRTEGIIGESSPVYWSGRLFIGSFDFNLYCLDAKTGRLVWKFRTQSEVYSTCYVDGGRVYFGSRDHNLYCLEAETGRLLWKFKTQDEIVSVPVVYRNRVYIGSFDFNLYCLDAETGGLLWKFTTQGEVHNMTPFLVHNGILHFTSFDNNLYAVDAETGRLVWKFPTGIYGNAAIPTLHGGILYHTNRDGNLFAISLGGKLIWKFTNKEHLSVPVIYEDRIFVGSEDMNLYCLSMDGRKLWSFRTEGAVFVNSAARDGRLFFPSWDCNLYCLEIATRRLVWKFRAEGSPSYLPPPYESFEVVMKIPAKEIQEERDKRYDFSSGGDAEREGAYKSRQTYRVSTQYREKGKYQVDSGEEAF